MHNLTISQTLTDIVARYDGQVLTYETLVQALGQRAFGLVTVLFALPSALPLSAIPGISVIFSLPIVFLAVQIVLARNSLWLPRRLAQKTIRVDKLAKVLEKARPWLERIERLTKPRWRVLLSWVCLRLHGLVLLALVGLLCLPIPFSNFIFASLIIIFGLGLAQEDGLFIITGYVLSAGYMIFLISILDYAIGLVYAML